MINKLDLSINLLNSIRLNWEYTITEIINNIYHYKLVS